MESVEWIGCSSYIFMYVILKVPLEMGLSYKCYDAFLLDYAEST